MCIGTDLAIMFENGNIILSQNDLSFYESIMTTIAFIVSHLKTVSGSFENPFPDFFVPQNKENFELTVESVHCNAAFGLGLVQIQDMHVSGLNKNPELYFNVLRNIS